MRPVFIYGLSSSADGVIRYIGQTVSPMSIRMGGHRAEAKKYPHRRLSRWMASVLQSGAVIVPTILVENAVWSETEREVIADYRARGFDLVNGTDGGDGGLGRIFKHSEASKKKLSIAHTGRKLSAEECQQRRDRTLGLVPTWMHTPEIIAKSAKSRSGKIPANLAGIHSGLIGKPKSLETRQKISKTLSGRKQSPDIVAKRKAAFRAFLAANPDAIERRRATLAAARMARQEAIRGLDA